MIRILINFYKRILRLCEFQGCYNEQEEEVTISINRDIVFCHKYCQEHRKEVEDAFYYARERSKEINE